ncbi:hypothetical protein PsYK624_066030 [Phanerochaete sordida]|uniref:Uncharacterized protein n=1 Tax=Phanerochaete sordida TaxID=48140 RepID=A0A9P3G9D0_9APHY|nr:hypothetical protein PsYK624_066030 [Phanerochaete sordida]
MPTTQPQSSQPQQGNTPAHQTDGSLDGPDQNSSTTTPAAQVDPVAATVGNNDPPPLGPPLTPPPEDDDDDEVEFVHASGRSRTKEQRLAAVGKRSGHPGRFTGKAADYLQGFVKQYEDIMRTYGGKSSELDEFYVSLRKTFWEAFKWQEIREMYGEGGSTWDKGRTMRAANDSMKGYYTYRWTRLNGGGDRNNPFKGFAKNLRKPTAPRAKSVTAVQLYLSDNIARVNELYTARNEESGKSGIALRTVIAKELLQEENEETQAEWARRAKEANEAADGEYREQSAGGPSDDPEDQEEARNRLVVFLKPFWKLLTQYTGLRNFTLLAGNPPEEGEEEYLLAVVNSGKTAEKCPRNFHLFNPEKFEKQVLGTFMEYLQATKESGGAPAPSGGGELPRFRMHGCEDDAADGTPGPEPEGAERDTQGGPTSGTTKRKTTTASSNNPPGDAEPGAPKPRPKPKPKPRARNLEVPEWAHLALRQMLARMSQKDMERELERLNKIPVEQKDVWSKENADAIWRGREIERQLHEEALARQRAREAPRDEADYVPEEEAAPIPPASPRVTRGRAAAQQSQPAQSTAPELDPQTAFAQPQTEAPPQQEDRERSPSPTPTSPTSSQRKDDAGPRPAATPDGTSAPGESSEGARLDPKGSLQDSESAQPAILFPASVPTANVSRLAAAFSSTASTAFAAGALGTGAGAQPSPSPPAPSFDDLPDNARWIEEQYTTLVNELVPPTYEYLWKKMLADWVELERALDFGYARPGFPPAHRPVEVGDWIQRARAKTVVPDKKEQALHATYKARWTAWWSSCNPAWRVRDADGHPAIGGAGDWSTMLIPGKNGWINILSSLVCLGALADVEDWARSMLDVQWAVQEVLAAKQSEPASEGEVRPDPKKRALENAPKGQPAAKRARKTATQNAPRGQPTKRAQKTAVARRRR